MNTIKDSRDIEGSPHYRKYWDGALRVISIKKHLRLLRSGKSNSNDDHNGFPTIAENMGVKQMEIENLMGGKVESTIGANFH